MKFSTFSSMGFLCLALLTGTASIAAPQTPAECKKLSGDSLADCQLQRDVIPGIVMFELWADEQCQNRKIINTEVLIPPQQVRIENNVLMQGTWQEKWTVDRCGVLIPYQIIYTADGKGGTAFEVKTMK